MEYKIAVLGSAAVGKSSIVVRYIRDSFAESYDPTIEDAYKKHDEFEGKARILDILDTAGMAEYSSLRTQYMEKGIGFVLVYSIIQLKTFQAIEPLIKQIYEVKQKEPATCKIPIIIVGNKVDLDSPGERAVPKEDGEKLAAQYGARFLECSAKTNVNIREIFEQLVNFVDNSDFKHKSEKKSKCPFL
ncbi:Rap, Ras family GTPase [Monocercomonoides exilis]|uniref:Rap, Ras family GTPase n=1 Tax=Monocercomonoides exilis TaxID=2049356 RepID=UPI003559C11B|nr:Rap, Ras family GTPase [Monocercomonoides exilis]|eukprot:MONOS_12900.1-p1 / transcript=MONOS_12900.1 / gene=MONOS_12900 / organism=Monocercomonoides_exilis_PA203 / gene_product=Rap, Ras family GTPase / transcript_product=Rap, Ras family GTPase / location=Mono_scaffold00748:20953-21780(-) / protein_length=188 / sequence_SO=supercontig / SO=protein_coding / is_pseudo=false